MNQINQRRDFSKPHSSERRTFATTTAQMPHFNVVVGNWGSAVKTSASYNWRNTRPNFNYNSGPIFLRTANAKGTSTQEHRGQSANVSEEEDVDEELIVVPTAVQHTTAKV
ncbi:hypothetical protein Tco_0248733, partial [Tanacetum coccineum]